MRTFIYSCKIHGSIGHCLLSFLWLYAVVAVIDENVFFYFIPFKCKLLWSMKVLLSLSEVRTRHAGE